MTKKRLRLILAREMMNLTKIDVAKQLGIEPQRYKRIELGYNSRVTVEEAYMIANFFGYEHPKELFIEDVLKK